MKNPISIIIIAAVIFGAVYFLVMKSPAPVFDPAPVSAPAESADSISVDKAAKEVLIQNFIFSQPIINIKKGDTVTWINKDSAPHTVTGESGGPSSQTLKLNDSYSFKFDKSGEFPYICAFHPSMKGRVVVSE